MIALALAAALFAADGAAQAAATPDKAPKVNKDGLICKKEAVVGSRMPTKVCLTPAQWELRKQESRDEVEAAQRNKPLTGN
jgi:hypothetical protein